MEDGFEFPADSLVAEETVCRNPYCSGRWFRICLKLASKILKLCRNPYCSGRWFRIEGLLSDQVVKD